MADSPLKKESGPVSYTIHCDGEELPTTVQIISIEIEQAINRIPVATIVIMDGDMAEQEFPLSDSAQFIPGTKIEINLGYDKVTQPVFTGYVIKHSIKINGQSGSHLIVECKDAAIAMTVGRKNANYLDKTDSDIIKALLGNYSLEPTVSATSITHKELVQFYCSDWDFMLVRAEVNGMVVITGSGAVTVEEPKVSAAPVLTVTYGQDLIRFNADLDARHQYKSVMSNAWDLSKHEIQKSSVASLTLNEQGNIDSATLADTIGLDNFRLQTPVPMDTAFLKVWANAQQTKSGLARIRGSVSFQGNALPTPGKLIELAGVGERFNGNVYISEVNHLVVDGDWTTTVNFGLAPNWFAEVNAVDAPLASAVNTAAGGLHIGVVMKLDADPESQYRIQVSIPAMSATQDGFWARIANFYSSNSFGAFFLPEIGDEVVLGFFNDDPSHPVILGSLYSSKNVPAYTPEAKNNTKAIVTRTKMKMEFDEDKKVITIVTPGENKIVISDDGKSILLQDQNSNKVTLDSAGITLDSPKDITLKAQGKIVMNAANNIEATAQMDIKQTGLNITSTANVGFTAKGSATAEVSASGTTTIKGAMVMIN